MYIEYNDETQLDGHKDIFCRKAENFVSNWLEQTKLSKLKSILTLKVSLFNTN